MIGECRMVGFGDGGVVVCDVELVSVMEGLQ